EGEERPLRQWDFVHCPPGTKHVIVGAGSGPSVVLAVGARVHSTGPGWGGYTVDEAAARHGASVERDTNEPEEAYARFPRKRAHAASSRRRSTPSASSPMPSTASWSRGCAKRSS